MRVFQTDIGIMETMAIIDLAASLLVAAALLFLGIWLILKKLLGGRSSVRVLTQDEFREAISSAWEHGFGFNDRDRGNPKTKADIAEYASIYARMETDRVFGNKVKVH